MDKGEKITPTAMKPRPLGMAPSGNSSGAAKPIAPSLLAVAAVRRIQTLHLRRPTSTTGRSSTPPTKCCRPDRGSKLLMLFPVHQTSLAIDEAQAIQLVRSTGVNRTRLSASVAVESSQ